MQEENVMNNIHARTACMFLNSKGYLKNIYNTKENKTNM